MSLIKAKEHLKKYNLDNKIIIHEEISDTVEHAAQIIGCKIGEIAKTMSFIVDDRIIAIVMSGEYKTSNSKYKDYFKTKAKMIPYNEVETLLGHEPGGVCPFGLNENIDVYLDESLKKYNKVYAAAGQINATIELTIPELEKASNYKEWIDISQIIE